MTDRTLSKDPTPDTAEFNAFFPSPYSLGEFTSKTVEIEGADYPQPYKGSRKILMIAADERVMEHWPVRKLTNQFDPAEMIEAMIQVLTGNKPAFRTVLPAKIVERVRAERNEAWDWTV